MPLQCLTFNGLKVFFCNQNPCKIKNSTAIATGAGIFLLYSLYRKNEAAGTLNFAPDKIRNLYFDSFTPVVVLGILVQNTSNQNFTLNAIAGDVFCKDQDSNVYIANVGYFTPQTIAKRSQKVVLLEARLFAISIVQELIEAIQYGHFQRIITLDGTANVDNLRVPVKLTFKIG